MPRTEKGCPMPTSEDTGTPVPRSGAGSGGTEIVGYFRKAESKQTGNKTGFGAHSGGVIGIG
jgi:hypothetical protein